MATQAADKAEPLAGHTPAPAHVWQPADAIARYQRAKLAGGVLFSLIFAGWMVIQWSNATMRWMTAGLIVVTLMVTWRSFRDDRRRAEGRKVTAHDHELEVVEAGRRQAVRWERVDHLVWIAPGGSAAAGLWWMDDQGDSLLHLDLAYFADEREARTFVGWLRQTAHFDAPVRWQNQQDIG